jgi:hypothetical protein
VIFRDAEAAVGVGARQQKLDVQAGDPQLARLSFHRRGFFGFVFGKKFQFELLARGAELFEHRWADFLPLRETRGGDEAREVRGRAGDEYLAVTITDVVVGVNDVARKKDGGAGAGGEGLVVENEAIVAVDDVEKFVLAMMHVRRGSAVRRRLHEHDVVRAARLLVSDKRNEFFCDDPKTIARIGVCHCYVA